MFTIRFNLFILSCIILAIGGGCTKNFNEINTDPTKVVYVSPDKLMPSALLGAVSSNMSKNRSFNNELMQVTVTITDGDGAIFRYDVRPAVADYTWNSLYAELTNFKDMYADSLSANKSYKGIALVCQAWLYGILTDVYGDIPFTEANRAKPQYGHITAPKFDRQKDIYTGLFSMLEEANTLLSSNEAINPVGDPVHYGDVSRWRKFGNSLYLRLLLRVSGKAETAPQVTAKMKEMIDTDPAKYPVFTSVDETAALRWTGVSPYTSPYIGIREQDFRAPAITSFFINNLTSWNDPRININTYGSGGNNRWGIAQGSGGFAGVPSGYAQGDVSIVKQSYFYSMTSKGNNMQNDFMTGQMMNYAELNLILAEAALKGWISGKPEDYYYKGAKAAINQWLPSWPKTDTVNIVSHLTAADQEWLDYQTNDYKMELIHKQKYYALFMVDYQQWLEHRRTGHPVLPKGPGLKNGGVMPARLMYPIYVQSTNPTNYKNAVAEQGPDNISTRVWWQKP